MDALSALLLGLVQGLTEFLPVSSTGHLILARDVLGLPLEGGLTFDATLHLATALAVMLYFRKDLVQLVRGVFVGEPASRTLALALVLGTIPAAVIGFFLEDSMDTLFRNPVLVALALIAGSAVFYLAERLARMNMHLTVSRGVAIGFFQALALIPGLSRSGMTISGGLLLGLTREQATRFAFLLSFPIILGAGGKKLLDLWGTGALQADAGLLALSALAAFLSGLAAIHFMIRFLRTHTLMPFIIYRVALAAVVLLLVL